MMRHTDALIESYDKIDVLTLQLRRMRERSTELEEALRKIASLEAYGSEAVTLARETLEE